MATTIPALTPPPGFRFMTAHEAECMNAGDPIVLLTPGGVEHALIRAFTDEDMRVTLRSGAIVVLDLDSPDYWPAMRTGGRRPPTDGESVAICRTGAVPDEDVEPLLRASVALAEMMKDDPELAQAVARVREIVSKRVRGIAA
jgi:hypothetical protein